MSVPSGRCAPCCSHEPIGIEHDVRPLLEPGDVRRREVEQAVRHGAAVRRHGRAPRRGTGNVGDAVGELGVVDVRVDRLERMVGPQRGAQRVEEGGVGLRVPERAARRVGEREAARRGEHAHRAGGLGEALGDQAAERDALLGGEPHERGHGVVVVATCGARKRSGTVSRRALVEEVAAAGDDDLRQPVAAGDPQPVRARWRARRPCSELASSDSV